MWEEIVSAYELLMGAIQIWMALFAFLRLYIYATLFCVLLYFLFKIPHIFAIKIGGWAERLLYMWRTKQVVFTDHELFMATQTDTNAGFVRELRKIATNWVRISTKVITYSTIFIIHGTLTFGMLYLIMAGVDGTTASQELMQFGVDIFTNAPYIMLAAGSFIILYFLITCIVLAFKGFEYYVLKRGVYADMGITDMWRQD